MSQYHQDPQECYDADAVEKRIAERLEHHARIWIYSTGIDPRADWRTFMARVRSTDPWLTQWVGYVYLEREMSSAILTEMERMDREQ